MKKKKAFYIEKFRGADDTFDLVGIVEHFIDRPIDSTTKSFLTMIEDVQLIRSRQVVALIVAIALALEVAGQTNV